MKLSFLLLGSMSLLASPAFGDNTFVCKSELATGFIYKQQSWKVTNFVLEQFTLRFSEDWKRLDIANEWTFFNCSQPLPYQSDNILHCYSKWLDGDSFQFDKTTGRFKFMNPSSEGFLSKTGPDTDVFYAGSCQPF